MTSASEADELAAPLDALLIEGALGSARRFTPDASTAKFVGKLLTRPAKTGQRLGSLAAELVRVGAGTSDLAPSKRDRRFTDPAWTNNPWLRRIVQAYLVAGRTAEELVGLAELDWRDERRVRFLVQNLTEAMAPSNVPMVNPQSAKEAIDSGGANFVRGGRNLARDLLRAPRIPEMVDTTGFEVGRNIAVTPGAVVYRSEVLELIQYRPQTETVRATPMLVVPPTINKFYAVDLAPGRSLVEYLVQQGQQVFMISWRNPDARHADWGLATYVKAVIEALDAVERITGTEHSVLTGICSGGIIASCTAAVLAGRGQLARLAGCTLLVTVLDNRKAGDAAAITDRTLATAAKALSRRKGYLDGRQLAEVFAWLRPGDLVWNYVVNNYLLGKRPPAFDILFWNADTTRMAAQLHADFVDIALDNPLIEPGALVVDAIPVDLTRVDIDSYVVAGVTDHITPWQNCYRTVSMLGGSTRFVLSVSGHIAALVNPPSNPKATFQLNPKNPPDPADWVKGASTESGSWWPDWSAWLGEHSGPERPAPTELGGHGLTPLAAAPGTYVFDQ